MDNPPIILVNPQDEILGTIDKITAHRYAMLHRAFSIFIYRIYESKIQLLLQQRQWSKYHCGGLWTNACCSHPLPEEPIAKAAERRLKEELNINCSLDEIGCFHYVAVLDNDFFENEVDHVLVGVFNDYEIAFNKDEVNAIKWININELSDWLQKREQDFTPWFPKALNLFLNFINKNIHRENIKQNP